MCRSIRRIFFIISIFFPSLMSAQAVNDAGLWVSFNLEKKLNKRFGVFLTEEYRRKENLTQTNLLYTEIGMSFKPYGFMKVSLSYRSIQKYEKEEVFTFRHRVTMDMVFKKKIGKVTSSYRERVQMQVNDINTSEFGNIPVWSARQKMELKYDLNNAIKPFVSVEGRFQFQNPKNAELGYSWNRIRYTGGFDCKMNEMNTFALYYVIQNSFNVSVPRNYYQIGVSYTLSL